MEDFKWKSSYSVGIRKIDEQHMHLFEILNQLCNAVNAEDPNKALRKILQELSEYTKYHFQTEESLFKENKYPDYDKHKHEHDHFIAKVIDFLYQYDTQKMTVSLDIYRFLSEWITEHIVKMDHQYAGFLKEKGVS